MVSGYIPVIVSYQLLTMLVLIYEYESTPPTKCGSSAVHFYAQYPIFKNEKIKYESETRNHINELSCQYPTTEKMYQFIMIIRYLYLYISEKSFLNL